MNIQLTLNAYTITGRATRTPLWLTCFIKNILGLRDVPSPKGILLGCLMKNHPSELRRWIIRTQVPIKNTLRPAFLQVLDMEGAPAR